MFQKVLLLLNGGFWTELFGKIDFHFVDLSFSIGRFVAILSNLQDNANTNEALSLYIYSFSFPRFFPNSGSLLHPFKEKRINYVHFSHFLEKVRQEKPAACPRSS